MIIKSFDNEVLGEHINKALWGVVNVSAAPHRLLTSDRPLAIYKPSQPDGYIALPISTTQIFIAATARIIGKYE